VTVHYTPELADLMEHERVIEGGLEKFWEVGFALSSIRDGQKFRASGFDTFEEYLTKRWGMSRTHGYRLIAAAGVAEALSAGASPIGDTLPSHESQVRPLTALEPEQAAAAWSDAVETAGGQPTAAEVAAAADKHRTPKTVPKPLPVPDRPGIDPATLRPHPAPYPDAVIAAFRELLDHTIVSVLDPFAGVGGIHQLHPAYQTFGVELEHEWAQISRRTRCGDARKLAEIFPDRLFDAICSSPAYGNRLADPYYMAIDPQARRSYALDLGRPLSDGNGAGMYFDVDDGEYEDLHEDVWAAAVDALRGGGYFLLNCKDFSRDKSIVPVTGWHIRTLTRLGLVVTDLRTLPAAGLPFTTAEPLSELVIKFEKPVT
jgi:hypothetical protein